MKRPLCICRTCRKPLPSTEFTRHPDGQRHDSCMFCESMLRPVKVAAAKEKKPTKKEVAAEDKARLAAGPRTHWVGGVPSW